MNVSVSYLFIHATYSTTGSLYVNVLVFQLVQVWSEKLIKRIKKKNGSAEEKKSTNTSIICSNMLNNVYSVCILLNIWKGFLVCDENKPTRN